MTVRSRRFFGPTAVAVPNTWQELWQVPPDRVARFSWLSVLNFAATPSLVFLGVGTAGAISQAFWQESVPAQTTRVLSAALVLEDDDELWVYSSSTSVTVLGAGSLLLGDPA